MPISQNINNYIKDSMINGKVCRFNKLSISVYISEISANLPISQKYAYYEKIKQAISIWNKFSPAKFIQSSTPNGADIIVNWVKTGIKFEGMCKFRSIIASEIKAITIEIGLPNPNSPKTITEETILHSALHELGHSLGLGHGISPDDLMFVPHQKTLNTPSDNDLYVLNTLYNNPIGTPFSLIKQ